MHFKRYGPEIQWACELNAMNNSWRAARAIQAAVKTGIAAALAERAPQRGHRAADIAAKLQLDPRRTEQLLTVLAALEMVWRIPDASATAPAGPAGVAGPTTAVDGQKPVVAAPLWQLSPRGQAMLDPASHFYQGHIIAHNANIGGFWSALEHYVRGESGGLEFTAGQQQRQMEHRTWIMAMHNLAVGGRGAALAEMLDLSSCRTLADVGGGPGSFSMALCQYFPDLRAVVMDLPETLEIARENIARLGMQQRVSTRVCDWNRDDFGHDNDAVLLSNVLHGGSSDARMKLEKARQSLVPGGRLIIQDFLINRDRTGPLPAALFAMMVGAFAVDELYDEIARAGFVDIVDRPMPQGFDTQIVTARRPD